MKIRFNLDYQTRWGETLFIMGSLPELGSNNPTRSVAMHYESDSRWTLEIDINDICRFEYRYLIIDENKNTRVETGEPHHQLYTGTGNLNLFDRWQDIPENKPFFTSAFTQIIFKRPQQHQTPVGINLEPDSMIIRCFAPTIRQGEVLALCGEAPVIGNWDPKSALIMSDQHFPEWQIALPISKIEFPLSFKFVILNPQNKELINWESGENHIISPSNLQPNQTLVFSGFHFNDPQPLWHGAGVAIPVFSLRSKTGYGIGEFTDLIALVDWAKATGQQFIQLLPINDTTMTHTWQDSYPYNANSIFALHPAYINVEKAGILQDSSKMEAFKKNKEKLNQLTEIDYEQVTQGKWEYIRQLFIQEGVNTLKSDSFCQFFEKNRDWLLPYAVFCYLRDIFKTPDFHWWKSDSTFNKERIEAYNHPDNPAYPEISLHYFIQYHLHLQLQEATQYARTHGIVLKGDIPIGISRCSVEAWSNPELFHLNSQAGAPPDAFSQEGQNWGFPTYNWEEMAKDNYAWWKKRLRKMAEYFDAYRIDHILGFFRIWEIPIKAIQGLLGHFNPALPYSREEIASFGFNFNHDRDTTPYIREYFLHEFFGSYTQEAKEKYLRPISDGVYQPLKEFDTQREIANYFNGQHDEKPQTIQNGLKHLLTQLLFLPDPEQPDKYHPRIAAQYTKSYEALGRQQQIAFDNLYNNFFYERHNHFWADEALKKLPPILSASDMLACGEDLGMIPASVSDIMHQLRILSLEVQRMPKREGLFFDDPATYPYYSVCTTSTHDMSPIREWWNENSQISQQYFNQALHREGWMPQECNPGICREIILQHLSSPAMLTILPLQDWLSIDATLRRHDPSQERINIPANPRHYWRYRMHLTLEQLLCEDEFNNQVRIMIQTNHR